MHFKLQYSCATLAANYGELAIKASPRRRLRGPCVSRGHGGEPVLAFMGKGIFKTMAFGSIRHSVTLAVTASALALVGGCATTDTGTNEPWDPIEGANRMVFSINRAVDMIAIRPMTVVYRDWVPEPAQKGVHNVVENLGEPVTAINEVVQGEPARAATTLGRFLVNSTIGIAGLFDVASRMGLKKTKEDMGKTIGYYAGVEPENGGFYIVMPLIGPSNARDGVGMAIDATVDPFNIVTFAISSNVGWIAAGARYGAEAIDMRTRTMYALDDLEKNSVDYYAALRSAYTQQRADVIREKRAKTDSRGELDRRDNLALVR
jgi:phospholipid-binding lipoprotein MlaA